MSDLQPARDDEYLEDDELRPARQQPAAAGSGSYRVRVMCGNCPAPATERTLPRGTPVSSLTCGECGVPGMMRPA